MRARTKPEGSERGAGIDVPDSSGELFRSNAKGSAVAPEACLKRASAEDLGDRQRRLGGIPPLPGKSTGAATKIADVARDKRGLKQFVGRQKF